MIEKMNRVDLDALLMDYEGGLSVALLELKNVTKYYHGTTPALDDVSFSVNEGEFVSVIGSSGAGNQHFSAALTGWLR